MSRVCIVGWDGATFDLILPWVEQGMLPNIQAVLAEGVHGSLRSTLPPMTFPAWSSFMTGKNPGAHGIFDFTRQRHGTYDLEFVNGGNRLAPTFWRLLSDAGRQVISISVPCTYPPERVNGIMLSGFDAPGLGGSGSMLDARGMYPPELCAELESATGGHPIGSFPVAEINDGKPELALEKILQTIRRKATNAKYLMRTRPWDCFMILFGESDGVGHHFWKYCDPDSPLYTPASEPVRKGMLRVYQELDRELGEIRQMLPADANLLMMSDHGFGGVSNRVLFPNCWLHSQGFLRFRGGWSRWQSRVLDRIKLTAVARLPSRWKRYLYRTAGRRLGSLETAVRFGMLDWPGTRAYFEENPYYPVLWINVRGRQPQGVVEPGAAYESVRDELIDRLHQWRHPATGERIVKRAYRREEIYHGAGLDEAPDIIVHWADAGNYSYAFKLSSKSKNLHWTEDVDPQQPENLAFFTGKSGSHRDDGIFLAAGPDIQPPRELGDLHITDLAPTILHLLHAPIPDDMDGRPLLEILKNAASRSVVRTAATTMVEPPSATAEYTADDEQLISARLRDLGYID